MKISSQNVRVKARAGAGPSLRGPLTAGCKTTVTVVVMGICLGLGTAARPASATVCLQHDGDTDPLAEGWHSPERPGAPATMDGEACWGWNYGQIQGQYTATDQFTLNGLQYGSRSAWEVRFRMKYVRQARIPNYPTLVSTYINDGKYNWGLGFDDDGIHVTGPDGEPKLFAKLPAPGFHDYAVIFDPTTEIVSYCLDGEQIGYRRRGVTQMHPNGFDYVSFGGDRRYPTEAYWSHWELRAVPEPMAICLPGMMVGLGLMRRRRAYDE